MKKFLLRSIYFIARKTGWRSLMFSAGILLISGLQSCRITHKTCYAPMPAGDRDSTTIQQPLCYKTAVPADTSRKDLNPENFQNQEKSE